MAVAAVMFVRDWAAQSLQTRRLVVTVDSRDGIPRKLHYLTEPAQEPVRGSIVTPKLSQLFTATRRF